MTTITTRRAILAGAAAAPIAGAAAAMPIAPYGNLPALFAKWQDYRLLHKTLTGPDGACDAFTDEYHRFHMAVMALPGDDLATVALKAAIVAECRVVSGERRDWDEHLPNDLIRALSKAFSVPALDTNGLAAITEKRNPAAFRPDDAALDALLAGGA